MVACGPRHCRRRGLRAVALAPLVEHDPAAVLAQAGVAGPAVRMAGLDSVAVTDVRPAAPPRRAAASPLRRSRAAPSLCPRRLW